MPNSISSPSYRIKDLYCDYGGSRYRLAGEAVLKKSRAPDLRADNRTHVTGEALSRGRGTITLADADEETIRALFSRASDVTVDLLCVEGGYYRTLMREVTLYAPAATGSAGDRPSASAPVIMSYECV